MKANERTGKNKKKIDKVKPSTRHSYNQKKKEKKSKQKKNCRIWIRNDLS